ncbi:MAG TPA: sortase [Patescibacteria group bacterium]
MVTTRIPGISISLALLSLSVWAYPFLSATLRPHLIETVPSVVLAPAVSKVSATSVSQVVIPDLGLTAPVTFLPHIDPLEVQDWNAIQPVLRDGVALTTTDESFDSAASSFLIGHSSDYVPNKYSFIFAGLNALKVGDVVSLTLKGKTYEQTVVEKKILSPDDSEAFADLMTPVIGKQRLFLVTCWPVFTTKQRLVVITERTHTE